MGRPGIMLYFDILEPIQVLTNAERGKLLTAILEYGKEGKKPEFRGKLALAWGFVQPKIDWDGARYDSVVVQRKYASYCKCCNDRGLPKISYDKWLEMEERQRKELLASVTDPDRKLPAVSDPVPTAPTATTTTANTVTNTNTSLSLSSSQDASSSLNFAGAADFPEEPENAAQRKRLKMIYENLKRGDAAMTDRQMDTLLDKMGPGKFGQYLTRLSDRIGRTGENIKSDYILLMRWWTEDVTC